MFQNVSKVVLCVRCITSASFSQDDTLHLSWQEQRFGDLHRHFAWQAQHFRRVVLRVFLRIAMSGLLQVMTRCKSRGRRGTWWQALHLVKTVVRPMSLCVAGAIFSTPYLTFTLYTPLHTLQALQFRLHTLHVTVCTLHLKPQLYTLHFTLHPTPYTLDFRLNTPHSTLYSPHHTIRT